MFWEINRFEDLLYRCSSIFRGRLPWYVRNSEYPISCNSTDPISGETPHIRDEEICDGIIHCPKAEDEDFERCKDRNAFPKLADFTCESMWMDNVTILATKCNSQVECKDGIDEKACAIQRGILWTFLQHSSTRLLTFVLQKTQLFETDNSSTAHASERIFQTSYQGAYKIKHFSIL